jgi:hypothetical protein
MISLENLNDILTALDRQILLHRGSPIGLVVCGGTALFAMSLTSRTTRDVDVLGSYKNHEKGVSIEPIGSFPDWFQSAAAKVGRDFDLPHDWINTGPEAQLKSGLPDGFIDRLTKRTYGSNLTVYYISRIDQIHFKLYAAIDQGGYHTDDLFGLNPTESEIRAAARWVLTQDVSENFRLISRDFLVKKGFHDIARDI